MGCAAPHAMHWHDLRAEPRERLLEQPGVVSGADGCGLEVPFLDARYRVDPEAEEVVELAPVAGDVPHESFQILLIRYLLAPRGGPVLHDEVSEKELPGGATFFRGPHAIPVADVARKFGLTPDAFRDRGLSLGATPVDHGDCGLRFLPFPEIPVTYVLWRADSEFPASVSILLDRSVTRWFSLDMVFLLVRAITERLVRQ
ncbi:DUF3786 domain-containing protein [Myxococcota bacterium]